MRTAWAAEGDAQFVWLLLLSSSTLYFFSINAADNDLWGHVLFGREILAGGTIPRLATHTYTAAGQPWVNHEWLAQVVFGAVFNRAGPAGLMLLKLGCAVATVTLLYGVMRRLTASAAVWGVSGLLAIAVLARGFAVRPQMFTYCGVALTLAFIDRYERGSRRVLWCLPALCVLWANLHGGFVLGLAVLAVFAAAALARGGTARALPSAVLIATLAASAVNPHGIRLLQYVWNELSRTHPITEWQPVALAPSQFVFFVMLGLFAVTVPFASWREQGWQVVLAAGAGALALHHQRHTPVFAVCAAAPLVAQLDRAADWIAPRVALALHSTSRRLIACAMVAVAALQIGFVGLRWYHDGLQIVFDPAEYPVEAVQALRQVRTPVNLAVPLDWGEYVLWFLAPQVNVSLDGRFATLFPEAVVADNFNFFSGAPGWQRLLDDYPTDAALVPEGSPCPVASLAEWRLVFQSSVARVYARAGTPAWPQLQRLAQTALRPPASGFFP